MRSSSIAIGLSLLAFAGSCGKKSSLADASSTDGNSTDATPTFDADLHGPVTVTVLSLEGTGAPVSGAPIAFIEPDGSLAAEVLTDVQGKAQANVLPGASVTAVYAMPPTDAFLETVQAVKPGDDITIGAVTEGATLAGFTVNVAVVAGTTTYTVYGPCGPGSFSPPTTLVGGTPTVPVTIPMLDSCKQDPMDLVAIRDDDTFTPVDYVEIPAVPFVDGGSVTQVAGWQPFASLVANYTNVPATVFNIQIADLVPDANGYPTYLNGSSSTGAAMMTIKGPIAATALVSSTLHGTSGANQYEYEQVDGTKLTYDFDVGAALLPWMDVPTFDPATATITVPLTGTGTGDVFYTDVGYNRPDTGGGGSDVTDNYEWVTWGPTAGNVTLPTLTGDLAVYNPAAGDAISLTPYAEIDDASVVTSYDQIRGHLDSAYSAYYTGRGATGSLHTSVSAEPQTLFAPRRSGGGRHLPIVIRRSQRAQHTL